MWILKNNNNKIKCVEHETQSTKNTKNNNETLLKKYNLYYDKNFSLNLHDMDSSNTIENSLLNVKRIIKQNKIELIWTADEYLYIVLYLIKFWYLPNCDYYSYVVIVDNVIYRQINEKLLSTIIKNKIKLIEIFYCGSCAKIIETYYYEKNKIYFINTV